MNRKRKVVAVNTVKRRNCQGTKMNHGQQLFRWFQKSNKSLQRLKCLSSSVCFLRCLTSSHVQIDALSRSRSKTCTRKNTQEIPWHISRCGRSIHITTFINSDEKERKKDNETSLDVNLIPDRENPLKDDPELKELIEEMKMDFNNRNIMKIQDTDNTSVNDSGKETINYDYEEYDYRYADDIEEYDEHELLSEDTYKQPEKVSPIGLNRGEKGVFDLEELHTLLEVLGADNVVTLPIPPEANFCDVMVVASAKSKRHLQAMNEELLWVHKRKKWPSDPTLIIEGLDKSHWSAMDMGNIVLHLFYGDAREFYDIESLWTLGPDLDPKCQEQVEDPYALSSEDLFWLETSKMGLLKPEKSSRASDGDADVLSKSESSESPSLSCPGIKPDL